MKTRHATLHLIAITLLSIAAAGQAVAITVTNNSDGADPGPTGSLRKAVNDAAAGDTIDFALPPGTFINLTAGQLLIAKNVTIVGPGARNLTITGNNASGIFEVAKEVTMNLSGLTLSGGSATARGSIDWIKQGGAIYNKGNLTITACRITGNRASSSASPSFGDASGGGIYNDGRGTLTMRDSEISSNLCDAQTPTGGGLYNNGLANLTNCTVSNNQLLVTGNNFGHASGAGIYNVGGSTSGVPDFGTLNLINCTINNNYFPTSADPNATGAGGGIYNNSTANLRNTIVAQNRAPYAGPDLYDNSSSDFTSQGHNLIGIIDNSGAGWITDPNNPNHDYTGTGAQPLVPGLVDPDGTFAPIPNGGPTNTVALLPTSPAVDKGDDVVLGAPYNLTTDQRGPGFSRKLAAHTDIGAFELDEPQVGPDFVVTTTDEHTDGLCGIADCTLLEALNASNANASANTITFAPGVAGTIINSSRFGRPITHPLTIIGPGARTLGIDGKGNARIFDVRAGAGSVIISGLTLANGKATVLGGSTFPIGYGGAILNAASLTLTDCSLIANSSAVAGGAILNNGSSSGNATLTVNNCTFAGNFSSASGGAILNTGVASGHATLSMTNCTLNQNIANQYGGAIYNDGTNAGNAALTLTNCTFNQNTANLAVAGGIYNDASNAGQAMGAATLTVRNTIFRAGPDGANLVNDQGTIASQGSNLSSDAAGGDAATSPGGFLNQAGDIRNTDPQLDTLKSNGGPTDTVALLAGSPAINAGNDALASPKDQRGKSRVGVSDIGAFEFTPPSGVLGNVSTRLQVGTGNNVLFAGFIIQGNASKTLLIRSAGPSLAQFGVPGTLGDPQLELHDANNTIGTNDNWQTTQIGGVITSDQTAAIQNSGAPPLNPAEPAIIATLPAGSYSAVVQGVGGTEGVATVEVYDLSQNNGAILANISTRGFIQTGDNVMIGGFIVVGNPSKVLVRATGPSLIPFGISNALTNPRLELHDGNGTLAANDDWQTTQVGGIIATDQSAAIQSSGLAPSNPAESTIIATLAPGNYTAIAQGVNGGTGVGLIEVFALP
jgi:fibronectin-binding autotransporter adhesin